MTLNRTGQPTTTGAPSLADYHAQENIGVKSSGSRSDDLSKYDRQALVREVLRVLLPGGQGYRVLPEAQAGKGAESFFRSVAPKVESERVPVGPPR